MSDFSPRRFEYGQPASVQQPFTHGGRAFKPGEPFPYDELKLEKWQVHGFWLASLIDFKPPAPVKPGSKPKHAAAR